VVGVGTRTSILHLEKSLLSDTVAILTSSAGSPQSYRSVGWCSVPVMVLLPLLPPIEQWEYLVVICAWGIEGRKSDKAHTVNLQEAVRASISYDLIVKRRAKGEPRGPAVSCHTFRATGITTCLENGGTIENAQAIAAHKLPRTTELYGRTSDEITLDEVERIAM